MPTQEEYWQALQSKVCTKCLDGDGEGNCRIGSGACALKTYFPKILDVVNSVQSHSIIPYENELRKQICSNCEFQSLDGECRMRTEVECALDRYFPLIVEVIEEIRQRPRLAASRWF